MYLSRNQHRIFYRTWTVNSPKAAVIIVHGLGEHSGRYQHLAEYLNTQKYSVFALDHLGHGQSDGKRGHIDSFKDYSDDLHALVVWVKSQGFENRVHLIGHSMGGLISTGYAIRYGGLNSIILSSPGFRGKNKIPKIKLAIIYLMAKVTPKLSLNNELDKKGICRSEEVVRNYLADPLVHSRVTPRWFVSFVAESRFVAQNLNKFTLPCLMLLAMSDLLVDPGVSENYFNGFSSSIKLIHRYPNAYHEIFNEVEEHRIAFAQMCGWLALRSTDKSSEL